MKPSSISVCFATLNAASVLEACLRSIAQQDYPKDKIEVIIADGGSKDDTVKIAKKYGAKIIPNPLKTSESGKAVAVKQATGELVAFIDSDNILPQKNWFRQMVKPFVDEEIILAEPIEYSYRKTDPILTRYCALIGMNDPICLFIGNYDRLSTITGRWTDLKFPQSDRGSYLKIELNHPPIPTIGANGALIRREVLLKHWHGDYLFDIDVLVKIIKVSGSVTIAKVKNGIVHTYVERDPIKFFRKQLRRVNDMMYYRARKDREVDWQGSFLPKILWFQLQCVLIVPIFWQAIKGYTKKPDIAWLFHPVAVYSTLLIYLYGWTLGHFRPAETDRKNWRQ
jgi:glycosyltransferase involved in cell wall biosynthesis